MRITSALVSVAAAAALVIGTTTPAGAATQVRTDQAGDSSAGFGQPPASVLDAADILTLRGVHGDGKLTFTVTVADLVTPGEFERSQVRLRLTTPTERDYLAVLEFSAGEKSVALLEPSRERTVDCDGLVGRAIASKDQYVVSIPRSCVRNPREVRFGGQVEYFGGEGSAFGQATDDARRDGTIGEEIRLGTRALANN